MPLQVIFCDRALPMAEAWEAYFGALPHVEILTDDLSGQGADALVVPTNAFGRLDGGLEHDVLDLFDEDTQRALQSVITQEHGGELLVGQAEVLLTPQGQFPVLVCAPTMRVPQNLARTVNAYLALRGALLAVQRFNSEHGDIIQTLLVPALAATNGFMPPLRAARQMRAAYDSVLFNVPPNEDISLDAGADGDDKYRVRPSEAAVPPQ
jgi:O-acetyl-ADP-ribose deacetylase (regulator of RNase III)